MNSQLCLHPITHLDDDSLLPWLDLYESAFPPSERIPVSRHLRGIRDYGQPGRAESEYFALLDEGGQFTGMAQWLIRPAESVVYLGYFAVLPGLRGQGIGGRFYRLLLDRLAGYPESVLMFDVEHPDGLPDGPLRQQAQARIRFYQRQGAGLVSGLTFCWGEPPLRLRSMIHPLRPNSTDEMLRRLQQVIESFGGSLVADWPGAIPGLLFEPCHKNDG